MQGYVLPLVLILIGVVIVILEMFIPSGGALGVIAGIVFLAAIIAAFYTDPYLGAGSIVLVAALIPVLMAVFVYWWPKTPVGRRMLLRRSNHADEAAEADDPELHLRTLVGKRGRAKTKMLPSGAVAIDGATYDAISEGLAIEAGQPVEVIALRLKRLVVRSVENDAAPLPPQDRAPPTPPPGETQPPPPPPPPLSPFEDPFL